MPATCRSMTIWAILDFHRHFNPQDKLTLVFFGGEIMCKCAVKSKKKSSFVTFRSS